MTIDFQKCLVPYSNHGVQFSYPDIWEIEEETDGTDIVITVSTVGTCFWTLRLLPGCPPPPQAVQSCVEAFREEYDDLEVNEPDCAVAEMPAYSRDLEFVYMELTNTVGLRSVRTTEFTLLIWWQGTDHELAECREMLDHMSNSIRAVTLIDPPDTKAV